MQHFVLVLSYGQPLLIPLIVVQLGEHLVLLILCAHLLVLDEDAVDFALIYESDVLLVPYLPLCASLQLLPGLLLHHGCVCVHVLPLKSDFLQFLGKSLVLVLLVLLLLADPFVCIPETLLPNGLLLRFHCFLLLFLLLSAKVVLGFSLVAGLLDLRRCVEKLGGFLVLPSQVVLSLLFDFLLLLPFVEFDALSQLGNRHFFQKTVSACLCWIKAFRSDDRDLFKLSDLPNELLFSLEFEFLFIFLSLESIGDFFVDLVP